MMIQAVFFTGRLDRYTDEKYANGVSTFILFGHENKYYDGKTLSSKNMQYIEHACKYASENGICIDFPQNHTFADTSADLK